MPDMMHTQTLVSTCAQAQEHVATALTLIQQVLAATQPGEPMGEGALAQTYLEFAQQHLITYQQEFHQQITP